ncbi:hypothetical protein [Alkalihalobacterium chitinilyticum]|uniref:Uncharacterized protein n=1 Tax=Alkalihalobacterium chitinilyticum TaxID=2980103 RepID=A0ABT5VKZ3_9BACI|nr:hypothetical protein [Alkalihalobacterium chitinilyticum]MDE5416120.1 hypothetical protein [Alkalihalobacterium chitinilyticum]
MFYKLYENLDIDNRFKIGYNEFLIYFVLLIAFGAYFIGYMLGGMYSHIVHNIGV